MKIGKIKIGRTWLIIIIIVVLIIGYYSAKSIFKDPLDGYSSEKISKGLVLQEVSETGSVRATHEANLTFKSIGKVSSIEVSVGDDVKKGDILAELDLAQLSAQLQSAKAALNSAKTEYNKLLNGPTPEQAKTYQDTVATAKNNLQSAYDGASNTLNDAYAKIYNAQTDLATLQKDYFYSYDKQGIAVVGAKNDIEDNMRIIKSYLDKMASNSDIDEAVAKMILVLDNVFNDLKIAREQCDQEIYYTSVPAASKTTLDTHKTYVNTAASSVTTLQKTISSYKIALQSAENNLAYETATARPEDVDIYKSKIQQAEASVSLYQSQLNDNYLVSPIDGKITEVNIKRGQVVSASQPAISLLSTEPFQIKVDIYEQDIVNVKVGNEVKIELVAFPEKIFTGKVLSIDPGEKIIDNVVYYEVTIDFPDQPEGVMSGMTADIVIETNKKEGVLKAPKNAIEHIDGKYIVEIFEGGKVKEREVIIGLEGNDYYEIIGGVQEGEILITGKK